MWTPNSVQVPTKVVIDCLSGIAAPGVLVALAAFGMFPKMTPEELMKKYRLHSEDVEAARKFLLTGSFVTEEKEESPSTPTIEEEPNPESDFASEVTKLVQDRFPESNPTKHQLEDLKTKTKGDVSWVEDAITVIYQGHLEKGNVYEPMGLVRWWVDTQSRIALHNKAHAIRSKPKSRDSIIGESLERARKNIPPPPGPTPEKIAARRERNEKLKNAKS